MSHDRFGPVLPTGQGAARPWTVTRAGHDIQSEIESYLLDEQGGIAQPLLIRKMSRTEERCVCWDSLRQSSSACVYCDGENYLWVEEVIRGYFTQNFGRAMSSIQDYEFRRRALIYLPVAVRPRPGDAIFRFEGESGDRPYYQNERRDKWRVVGVEDKREERGRLAYFICATELVEI